MGLTHVDAGVLIGFLDRNDVHHDAARRTLQAARSRGDHIGMAASALAECLVGPARRGDDAVATVLELVRELPISVTPLDERIAVAAARLRGAHRGLKLPDALVIATAEATDASRLATTDRGWPPWEALGVGVELDRI